jgi:chromosome segregation ATPase
MSNSLKARTRAAAAAERLVTERTAHRDRIRDERDALAAQIEDLSARIQAAIARGTPADPLEAERQDLETRWRDREAVLPTIEQGLAEARAELHAAEGQLVLGTRQAKTETLTRDGRALVAAVIELVNATATQRAALRAGFQELAQLDEQADRFAGRKHTRGPRAVEDVARAVPLLLNVLFVLDAWAAGRPAFVEVPAPAPRPTSELTEGQQRLEAAARASGAR